MTVKVGEAAWRRRGGELCASQSLWGRRHVPLCRLFLPACGSAMTRQQGKVQNERGVVEMILGFPPYDLLSEKI